MRSILIDGVIAPLAAPLTFLLGMALVGVSRDGLAVGLHDWPAGLALVTMFVLPVSYIATWILGVPFILWLRARSRLTAVNVCGSAIILGVASAWVFQWFANVGPLRFEHLTFGALLGASLALCVAITFCAVVRTPLRKAN
jgi:hypothetical protein